MSRRTALMMLAMLFAIAGCSRSATAGYESALTQEATSVAGLPEAGLKSTAFRAAEKKRTNVAMATSSGASSGLSGASTGETYYARVVPSGGIRTGDSVELILMVGTRTGQRVPGARATVTCTYVSDAGRQTKSYTMTTGADGTATKSVAATPFNCATQVTISGYVIVGGSRIPINGIGYHTIDI